MDLADLSEDEFKQILRQHIGFDEQNTEVWDVLTSDSLIVRTKAMLVDMEQDVDAQLSVRKNEHPEWAKRAFWFRSLVRRRIARVNAMVKHHNVQGKLEAQEWQGIALHLAQAIARHEAALIDQPAETGDEDVELWSILDSERRQDGSTMRNWLMNLVVPQKYQVG